MYRKRLAIACNAQKLHYRTQTEAGSAGSPIFDSAGWRVVGLHHAGRFEMPSLNGPPGEFYAANEGIAILDPVTPQQSKLVLEFVRAKPQVAPSDTPVRDV